mgnify:CR=1 FL=1
MVRFLVLILAAVTAFAAPPVVRIEKPMAAPDWALAERGLLKAYAEAAE